MAYFPHYTSVHSKQKLLQLFQEEKSILQQSSNKGRLKNKLWEQAFAGADLCG